MDAMLKGASVLVVDDDDDARELVATMLRLFGAGVRGAGSVAEALEMWNAEPADLLLSDLAMPQSDGCALVRAIRAAEAERGATRMPAIALTGHAFDSHRQQALEAGFDAHITKPVEMDALLALARQLIAR
jgi:CheY-like chemotaxis protein